MCAYWHTLAHTSKQVNCVSVAFTPQSCPLISQHPTVGDWPNQLVAVSLFSFSSWRRWLDFAASSCSTPSGRWAVLTGERSVLWLKGRDIRIIPLPVLLLPEWIWVRPCVTDSLPLSPLRHTKGKGQELESGVRVEGRAGLRGRGQSAFLLFLFWQCNVIGRSSHGCLVLPLFDTFTLCHHSWK